MTENESARETMRSLYDLYADDIYRYASLTLGDRVDAYDVVQEVFMRAFRSFHTYRKESSAKTWLMRIARNHIYDLFRKKRVERKYISDYQGFVPTDGAFESESSLIEIREMLDLVKAEYRQVIVLRYIENLSVSETAIVLQWSEAKVRTTTHRAIGKLRTMWGGVIGDGLGTQNY